MKAVICANQEEAGKRAYILARKADIAEPCESGDGEVDTRAWATTVYDPDVFAFHVHPVDGRWALEVKDTTLVPADAVVLPAAWFEAPVMGA